MNKKHRTTPIAPAPMYRDLSSERPIEHVLKAPIVVVTPVGEFEHERGSLVLGRAEQANIVFDDPLISRLHARLTVLDDEVVILEDLHSRNGVFVNGARLARPSSRLSEGDRLLLGTTEVSVFSGRASATIPIEHVTGAAQRSASPKHGTSAAAPATSGSHLVIGVMTKRPVAEAEHKGFAAEDGRPPATTDRSSAVELVGELARRLMDSGRSLEAVRMLSEHLNNVLLGASAGLSVPDGVLFHATRFAIELSRWSARDAWLDYVFQLHLACQRVPSAASLDLIEGVALTRRTIDRELIEYFVGSLQSRALSMSHEDQLNLARVARLLQSK